MSQTQRISKNNTVVLSDNGITTVILHQTPVVTINEKERTITFNNGGWVTPTTQTRMNQACNEYGLAYCVGRKKGDMSARNHRTGEEFPFNGDSLTVPLIYA